MNNKYVVLLIIVTMLTSLLALSGKYLSESFVPQVYADTPTLNFQKVNNETNTFKGADFSFNYSEDLEYTSGGTSKTFNFKLKKPSEDAGSIWVSNDVGGMTVDDFIEMLIKNSQEMGHKADKTDFKRYSANGAEFLEIPSAFGDGYQRKIYIYMNGHNGVMISTNNNLDQRYMDKIIKSIKFTT